MRSSHGWREIDQERKREIIAAIESGTATKGPVHAELDLTDRCNVACYFCNQQDVRSSQQVPIERAIRLIDELVAGGLKSVRMSGGGDPLFHKQILDILQHLRRNSVVIDNLTTNGVALTPEIARVLVESRAREVIFSLNAVDAADYHRMLAVKPAFFDQVLGNIRSLVAARGEEKRPHIIVQFLLDRGNVDRMVEMYELAVSLGIDTVFFGLVLEIPFERIDRSVLLHDGDVETARPLMTEILRRDKQHRILEAHFPLPGWQAMTEAAKAEVEHETHQPFPIAASFQEKNGGCFFGWYTTVVSGNGNIHPCCLLMRSDRKPLGNLLQTSFAEQWNGPAYREMREEMRDVLISGSAVPFHPDRFKILDRACTEPHLCWLKNMYFRGDEEFYAELGQALERMRGRAGRLSLALHNLAARHPRFATAFYRLRAWRRRMTSRVQDLRTAVVGPRVAPAGTKSTPAGRPV